MWLNCMYVLLRMLQQRPESHPGLSYGHWVQQSGHDMVTDGQCGCSHMYSTCWGDHLLIVV